MKDNYEDIISLPRPRSKMRTPMSMHDRAAQFSPFAALTGYEALIKESGKPIERQAALCEDELGRLNSRLQEFLCQAEPLELCFTCFIHKKNRQEGAHIRIRGRIKKIDEAQRIIILQDGKEFAMDDIISIEKL